MNQIKSYEIASHVVFSAENYVIEQGKARWRGITVGIAEDGEITYIGGSFQKWMEKENRFSYTWKSSNEHSLTPDDTPSLETLLKVAKMVPVRKRAGADSKRREASDLDNVAADWERLLSKRSRLVGAG